jgi:hypothetical protein
MAVLDPLKEWATRAGSAKKTGETFVGGWRYPFIAGAA